MQANSEADKPYPNATNPGAEAADTKKPATDKPKTPRKPKVSADKPSKEPNAGGAADGGMENMQETNQEGSKKKPSTSLSSRKKKTKEPNESSDSLPPKDASDQEKVTTTIIGCGPEMKDSAPIAQEQGSLSVQSTVAKEKPTEPATKEKKSYPRKTPAKTTTGQQTPHETVKQDAVQTVVPLIATNEAAKSASEPALNEKSRGNENKLAADLTAKNEALEVSKEKEKKPRAKNTTEKTKANPQGDKDSSGQKKGQPQPVSQEIIPANTTPLSENHAGNGILNSLAEKIKDQSVAGTQQQQQQPPPQQPQPLKKQEKEKKYNSLSAGPMDTNTKRKSHQIEDQQNAQECVLPKKLAGWFLHFFKNFCCMNQNKKSFILLIDLSFSRVQGFRNIFRNRRGTPAISVRERFSGTKQ